MPTPKEENPLRLKIRQRCEDKPGVYRFLCQEQVIYVGRSKNVRTRLLSYFRADYGEKAQRIVASATDVSWEYTPSEFESHLTELRLIKALQPHYNSALKYDLDYVFVHIGEGIAPRLVISEEPSGFGPFRSPRVVEEAVRKLSDVLQLRTSPDTTPLFAAPQEHLHPRCLRGQIGLCSAPCAGRVTPAEYKERLTAASQFLSGKKTTILKELEQKMKEAAQRQEFERAAIFRDRAAVLSSLARTLSTLRDSLRWLTFVYEVPGDDARTTLFFLHGGRVLGRVEKQEASSAKAKELLSQLQSPPKAPKSAAEMDEIKVVANWFNSHPKELRRTYKPERSQRSSARPSGKSP